MQTQYVNTSITMNPKQTENKANSIQDNIHINENPTEYNSLNNTLSYIAVCTQG
jgi:hypothetical protein